VKRILAIACALTIFGCGTGKINSHKGNDGTRLFPYGTYEHAVTLKVKRPQEKSYRFNGVVKLTPERNEIVAMSFLGTTEFRIQDDLKTKNIKVDIFRENFKSFEPRLREYYGILKIIFDLPPNPPSDIKWKNQVIHFTVVSYDKDNVPDKIHVEHPDFNIDIKVSSYEI
jgi:hypothetical protein